ncbi:eukaryotic translation initiation factor 3 subunit D [Lipomyces tetrasporus]|uniref:Eukaryotic translation initiation factor 3 subunit D n=1 Tax=Lipomyces tetrasporus TaxID=54092 RepID=A0AAD7QMT3_9ASCO|nr:eukaryotic translation initiation factor 3 subunit D [Lipomyces tetrasporus]KAJ8097875.1 eukaryotic translation initiation factor 3 subunit D [Lipomyces tetrasporus]
MAPTLPFVLPSLVPVSSPWGPPATEGSTTGLSFEGAPYAPFSKSDKLGKLADWTQDPGRDGRDQRGGRQNYGRGHRDPYQAYGASTASSFQFQNAEDESSFSVVDSSRTTAKPRTTFGQGGRGGLVLRSRGGAQGRGGARGFGAGAGAQRSGYQRYGGARMGHQDGARGGQRGGRGGRRFGWKDYDKPQRLRDSSVTISPDWQMLEEIDFNRLAKLSLDIKDGTDVDTYGFTYYYDKSFDRPGGISERKLQVIDTLSYNPTTSDDPVIQQLAQKDEARVFATDSILSMLMCAPRSVYPWDIVVNREGDKLFLDKREGGPLDFVTVNENAAEPPMEVAEGSKDSINTPSALALEATFINQNFAAQAVIESSEKHEFTHPNPFYNPEEETEPLGSRGYRYRKINLASAAEEMDLNLIVRTEVDGTIRNASGEDSFITIKALNEFDTRAPGAGGALDWRSKFGSQRGAVVATEMKNNSCKLARWTVQSILASADQMKLGFVSRVNPKDKARHAILGVVGYKPRDFANQMNYSVANGWGIARSIVDMCLALEEGKYIIVKDPNKPVIRLYEVPRDAFDDAPAEKQDGDE